MSIIKRVKLLIQQIISSFRIRDVCLHMLWTHATALYHNETSGVENTTANLVINVSSQNESLLYLASKEVTFALLFIRNRLYFRWIRLHVFVIDIAHEDIRIQHVIGCDIEEKKTCRRVMIIFLQGTSQATSLACKLPRESLSPLRSNQVGVTS